MMDLYSPMRWSSFNANSNYFLDLHLAVETSMEPIIAHIVADTLQGNNVEFLYVIV